MQKATPLLLVLFLAVTAVFLSNRERPEPSAAPAESSALPAPRSDVPAEPVKVDQTAAPIPSRTWPQDHSDIPADADAKFGTLDNGFRYIIYPNAEPPKRVSLRLHIAAGSLMERDDQQGLAHFLEHMVFNGSKHYTAAELIPRMQRLGISFGAHANAYTSFDETVYMLDLPDLSEETMKLGFTVMRDFGDGALLEESEINRERGVILSEKMSRDSVGYRLMQQQFSQLLPGSLLTRRFPIGEENVIKEAGRDRFVDFYSRYYTPQRMTFIVVGDVDPADIEKTIAATFGPMTNPEQPGDNPDLGPIRVPEGLETAVFADKEAPSTDVSLMLFRPHVEKADTVAHRIEKMPLDLAHSMLSRRFERLAKIEDSPITSGSASDTELFNYLELGSIDVTAADDRWQEAVPLLEKEFRRVLEYGFTEAEFAEAKANLLNRYQQAVKQEPSRRSEAVATVLARSVNDNTVFSDPGENLRIVEEGLASLDATACHAAFKDFWDTSGQHLVLTTKEHPENAEQTLATLFNESRGVAVVAPEVKALEAFAYTDFGKPGTVASRNEIADLGITQLVLSNQVRVNLKPTDFEKNRIRLTARVGSGKLSQPRDKPMLDAFATAVFEGGGLGKHSNDDLQQILAGKNVASSLSIDDDAFVLSGASTPADLQTQLQLMAASLTDPGYRNEALWQFQKSIPVLYQQLRHTVAGPQQEMNAWLAGGDPRFAVAQEKQLATYTIDDAKAWLNPELSNGYLELSLVGDFEIDAILPDLLATFGALSSRDAGPPTFAAARVLKLPNAPAMQRFTYESKIPQGVATAIWKTGGIRGNQREFRRLNLLGEIYGDRLRDEIREKLGASYSPNAGASGSDAYENLGYLIGQSVGKPEDVELLLNTMRDIADKIATEGADQDEFERALNPLLGQLDRTLRDNGYWLNTVLSQSQADPERLELARDRSDDYRAITLKEINVLAKKYLAGANALLISIAPQE